MGDTAEPYGTLIYVNLFLMDSLIKYGLRFLLLFDIFLSGSCADKDSLSSDEELVMVSLNFNSSDRISSRGPSGSPVVNDNAENFLKTLRILVFSNSGGKEVVYNKLFTPAAYQTWTTQLYIRPGTYTFHAVANEVSCMTETLDGISNSDSFHNLPCMNKVKREDGMIRDNGGHIVAFLMKGEVKNVDVHTRRDGSGDLTVTIPLMRLLAKVEMRFENRLPFDVTGGFESFSLGAFPRYFSYFENGDYPASIESGDGGKEWTVNGIETERSYVYYIPPYTPFEGFAPYTSPKRVGIAEYSPLKFFFHWNVGGYKHSHSMDFRESDRTTHIKAVKSNNHYKYLIRLKKSPQSPLEVECIIAPWYHEKEQEYYVDDCCNLKIEKDGIYTKFILQHVKQEPNFVFPKERYSLQINFDRGYDTYVKFNNGSELKIVDASDWESGVYKVSFRNDGTGKAVLYIRTDYSWFYGRCYFNMNSIYDIQ